MAQIQQTFTYALPTELYVAGISTVGIGTYTYVGPDTFTVEIDAQGRIIMINPTDPGGMGSTSELQSTAIALAKKLDWKCSSWDNGLTVCKK